MSTKGKSNNPPLGNVECDGCDGFATVRRRSNGRRLLYTHCVNCGMNQMSGEKLQSKWEKAINGSLEEIPALNSEPVKQDMASGNEWMPQEVRNEIERIKNETKTSGANENARASESTQRIENETDRTSGCAGKSSNGFGFFIFGAFAGLAAIAGIRR
ncbi:hypothetical protein [Pseudoalteromonas sp. NZS37]|uniref:hypothetical protein n=1 Tax=Pseudoalteromonas sp. NZS37 TaxID=2792071 RepID=UPI0018CDD852|nr:hypothetical protein [Pseudoalteromonas sp. NZS37]MBG9993382.1 hypothetical protein [Pseudoalteromonas sp. NZS37]